VTADQQPRTAAQHDWDNQQGDFHTIWHGSPVDRTIWKRTQELSSEIAALRDTVAAQAEQIKSVADAWSDTKLLLDDESAVNRRQWDEIAKLRARIRALELPASAPDRVQCPVCGEMANAESLVTGMWQGEARCNCPISDPATAHQEPPDAVLVAIRDLYVLVDKPGQSWDYELPAQLRHEWLTRTNSDVEQAVVDTDAAIRAYGRDGAR